jgi:hypothetical protein
MFRASTGYKACVCGKWYFYDDYQRAWVELNPGQLTVILEVSFATYVYLTS